MSQIIVSNHQSWLQYFNRRAAIEAVFAHVAALPSSRTDERHTARAYSAGLEYFTSWVGDDLPTSDKVQAFIAHLVQKGLKSSTIGSKYLAPVRHYLKHLSNQMIPHLRGSERDFAADCREYLRQAAGLPTPKRETTTNVAPLWRPEFNRLTVDQVNAILRKIDRSTLSGLRDYAMLHMAFMSGLRLAEIARVSPDAIKPVGDGSYLITVRGKRSNVDPVPINEVTYQHILSYIRAFNDGLSPDDPRRIQGWSALWQPLHRARYYIAAGRYNPARGMSHQAIRDVIGNRSFVALGIRIAPHDTRRTAAAIAYDRGMQVTDIQQLLRHKDAAVTLHYVGTKPEYHKRALSTYVSFG